MGYPVNYLALCVNAAINWGTTSSTAVSLIMRYFVAALATVSRSPAEPGLLTDRETRMSTGRNGFTKITGVPFVSRGDNRPFKGKTVKRAPDPGK
jgi:hypothetical protein